MISHSFASVVSLTSGKLELANFFPSFVMIDALDLEILSQAKANEFGHIFIKIDHCCGWYTQDCETTFEMKSKVKALLLDRVYNIGLERKV